MVCASQPMDEVLGTLQDGGQKQCYYQSGQPCGLSVPKRLQKGSVKAGCAGAIGRLHEQGREGFPPSAAKTGG